MLKERGNRKSKVAVAISGGVDSSTAAGLLKEKGFRVIGLTMKTWSGKSSRASGVRHGCYGPEEEEEIVKAQKAAEILQIPFHVFDLSQEYEKEVLDYFRCEYLGGRTPNPCLRCNRLLKFDALMKKAEDCGVKFDYFASGHYARVEYDEERGRHRLKKAKDERKDQSYFLAFLSQSQLGHLLLPLGNYYKAEVREIARQFGLPEESSESQDFTSGGYLRLFKNSQPGPILDREGNLLGRHRGLQCYTIGQRRGLGLAKGKPLYVTCIDPRKNAIIVGSKDEIYAPGLVASGLNWIAIANLKQPARAKARIRYKQEEAEAELVPLEGDKLRVNFEEPQPAITPGQAVVFYQGEVVLGGGTIEEALR